MRRVGPMGQIGSVMQPETCYAKSGDVHIAYQVIGNGPIDMVFVPPEVTHLEYAWQEPSLARFYGRLATFSRLILLDKRGVGLSDRVEVGTIEERMDDVRAVMDAAGSPRAAVFGASEGGAMAMVFAATYPERTSALVLYGAAAARSWAPEYPWRPTRAEVQAALELHATTISETWGRGLDLDRFAPSRAHDEAFRHWWAARQRLGASPRAALALWRMNAEIDARHVLPTISVPTLVLHRVGDATTKVEEGRYLAERIPGAKCVELSGADHVPWVGNADVLLDEIEEFLTGTRPVEEAERVLATVLFTDIVGSTGRLAELGDRRWLDLLEHHYRLAREEITRYRGREVKSTGDGLLATFDGPARAIRCATAIRNSVRQLGIEIRAGLHTGEVELLDQDLGGIAVHLGARVVAEAEAGEVLVSSTVKDLVAGSGVEFEDRGTHTLKGVPGEWRLFRVTS